MVDGKEWADFSQNPTKQRVTGLMSLWQPFLRKNERNNRIISNEKCDLIFENKKLNKNEKLKFLF